MSATMTLREWLAEEPFMLALSSGFFGFFAHAGLMTVLEDEGLLPTHLAGSSAGALVSGLWAGGVDAVRQEAELRVLRREDFWDPRPGLGLLRGTLFRQLLDELVGGRDFASTRAKLALSVYELRSRRTRVLDRGLLSPAIHASCAVPFLFHPVAIDGRLYVDGGVADRPGVAGLPKEGRVLYHHLVSRSPWRFAVPVPDVESTQVLTTLALPALPRVGPFRLHEGPRAFAAARARFRVALDQPWTPRLEA